MNELRIWENLENLPMYLRRRWVHGGREWLSGMHGSKENNKDILGYTDGEWNFIWSTMLSDGAWSVPAITDKFGNVIKDNLAPELFIKFIAHDVRCHIVVFDLILNMVQFCSANHLKDNNMLFDAPILLYTTGNHFQAVYPLNTEYFVNYARDLEYSQSNAAHTNNSGDGTNESIFTETSENNHTAFIQFQVEDQLPQLKDAKKDSRK